MIGAILPDVSLSLMGGLILLKILPETVFGELYSSDAWQMVFAIDNLFLIWLGFFCAGHLEAQPMGYRTCGCSASAFGVGFSIASR
ncbi:hypothetical protein N9777_04230 [Ascidiaceihabitans sp.]|nr:hypothetical protein [Ascidiaceihabitans sp.]